MSTIDNYPNVLPLATIEQPYSAEYFTRIATFIHHAPFHVITPITKAPTKELLTRVLKRTRHQPKVLPKPSDRMKEMCIVLVVGLNSRKKRWRITRGIIPLALLLLWRFRYARELGKGRDENGIMYEDHVWAVVAVGLALASITDTELGLTVWSELTGIRPRELRAAFTAFENAIEHKILATEAEFGDWTWRTDKLWQKALKVPSPETS